MKKILFIARAKTPESRQKAHDFAVRMQRRLTEYSISECEISELAFEVGPANMRIYHPQERFDLKDFDLVVIRHIGAFVNEAQAITLYCAYHGVRYTDSYLNRPMLDNKMSTQFLLWTNGVKRVPYTIYGPIEEQMHRLPELGKKAIFKDNEGSKGRLNFVVRSAEEIAHIQAEHPSVRFVMQAYIPNSSDLRVLVMDGTTRLVIRRSGTGDSHLNNTSQGGAAEIIDKRTVPAQAIAMAEDAARITKLEVAGVDVMFDDNTGEEYILEVNNAPQISSGSFQQEKVDAYAELIHDLLDKPAQSRKKQTKKAPAKRVIGQVEKVSFPLMNETELYARIDSGAKTSSIWAMEAIERKDGLHVIIGPHSKDKNAHVVFPMYDKVRVTSSNGISQERYRVRMPIRLAGKKFTTSFTLADRSTQVYPVLIGRSALQRRFIVDVQKDMTTEEKLLL